MRFAGPRVHAMERGRAQVRLRMRTHTCAVAHARVRFGEEYHTCAHRCNGALPVGVF